VPACIAPYIVRRTGEGRARRYILTGERFDAKRAAEIGLVNDVAPSGGLDAKVDEILDLLLSSGPEALAQCKELLNRISGMDIAEAGPYAAEIIARLRISPEGQEGMASFLEKRKPKWTE
jgi:methylglutaconyl-CoA hydratase